MPHNIIVNGSGVTGAKNNRCKKENNPLHEILLTDQK
jgi:hypothetical protein